MKRVWAVGIPMALFLGMHAASLARAQERQVYTDQEPQVIRQTFEQVLSSREYRSLRRPQKDESADNELPAWLQWLEDFFDWLFEDREDSTGTIGSIPALNVLVYALVCLAAAVVLFLLIRSILAYVRQQADEQQVRRWGSEELAPAVPPAELPPEEYELRALQLAQQGNLRGAVRQLLLGGMSWVERAGAIRFRRGLTNRDYLRAVWQRTVQKEALSAIVQLFELVYFGRRPATADRFQTCLQAYRGAFREPKAQPPLAS